MPAAHSILIAGKAVPLDELGSPSGQAMLRAARSERIRPLCLCRLPPAELVIRFYRHAFLARMPGQAKLHSPECDRGLRRLAQTRNAVTQSPAASILLSLALSESNSGVGANEWEAFRQRAYRDAEMPALIATLGKARLFVPPTFSSAYPWQGANALRQMFVNDDREVVVVAPVRGHRLQDGVATLRLKYLPTERFVVGKPPPRYPCLAALTLATAARPYVALDVHYAGRDTSPPSPRPSGHRPLLQHPHQV